MDAAQAMASPARQVQSMPHHRLDRDPSRYGTCVCIRAIELRCLHASNMRRAHAVATHSCSRLTTFPMPGYQPSGFQVRLALEPLAAGVATWLTRTHVCPSSRVESLRASVAANLVRVSPREAMANHGALMTDSCGMARVRVGSQLALQSARSSHVHRLAAVLDARSSL